MGKVKTVTMGDEIAEQEAREKAREKRELKKQIKKVEGSGNEPKSASGGVEAKREQKRLEKKKTRQEKETKKQKDELSVLGSQLSEEGSPVVSQPMKQTEKPKTDNRHHFPAGKKYLAAKAQVDPKQLYSVSGAIALVKKTSYSQFDGTIEVHLNVTDKSLRGTVSLPHGTGKEVRVKIADDTLIVALEKSGKIDFDVLVAEPAMMLKLAKVAKILGPKGLMPNPKTNTISNDPKALAKSLSKGQLNWKTQPDFPIVHTIIGKISFENKKLEENLAALLKSIGRDKINSVFLKATMGPSIRTQI